MLLGPGLNEPTMPLAPLEPKALATKLLLGGFPVIVAKVELPNRLEKVDKTSEAPLLVEGAKYEKMALIESDV